MFIKDIISSEEFREEKISEELKLFKENKISIKIESISTNNQRLLDLIALQIRDLNQISQLSLIFENNAILREEDWNQIFSAVSFLTQLESLEINIGSLCFLEDTGLNTLTNTIKSLNSINSLKLSFQKSNYISAISVKNILSTLQILPLLTTLELEIAEYQIDIGSNRIYLWEGLSYLKNLHTLNLKLNLNYNHEGDIEQLLSTLLTYKHLTNLTLDFNYIQSQINFVGTLTKNLSQLTQLKQLSLELNKQRYTVEELDQLSTFFTKLVNLEVLNLNSIFDKIVQTNREIYYDNISQLQNLNTLRIVIINDRNKNTSKVESAVQKCLQRQKQLQNLFVQMFGFNLRIREQTLFELANNFQTVNKHLISLEFLLKVNMSMITYTELSESFKYLVSLKSFKFRLIYESDASGYSKQIKLLDGIGSIHSLESLILSVSIVMFQDQQLDFMTFDFLRTLKLTSFDLVTNKQLTIREQISLGQGLQQQSELKALKLDIANLFLVMDDESAEEISKGFKSLQNLNDLNLSLRFMAHLQPEFINQITNSLNQLQKLRSFKYENTSQTSYDVVSQITQAITSSQDLNSLHFLNLRSLTQEILQETLTNIGMMTNLKHLFIQLISTSYEQNLIGFDNFLSNLPNLETFECKIIFQTYGFFFLDLMRGLRYLKQLQFFKLENTILVFTDKEAQEFNKSCSSLANLRTIKLGVTLKKDTFTYVGITHLYEGLSKLTRLQECKGLFFDIIFPFLSAFSGVFNLSHLQNLDLNLSESVPSFQPVFQLFNQIPLNAEQLVIDLNSSEKENDVILSEEQSENFYKRNTSINSQLTQMKYTFQRIGDDKAISSISDFIISLENLSRLNELHLNLSGGKKETQLTNVMNSLLTALNSWNKLQKLNLIISNCQLDFSMMQGQHFQSLQSLQILNLRFTQSLISSDLLLLEQLQYLSQLQQLQIHIEVLASPTDIKLLGLSLTRISKLSELDLIFKQLNHVEEEPMIILAKGIGNQKYLQTLNLQFPSDFVIGEDAGIEICNNIKNLLNLSVLQFILNGNNKMSERSGIALATSLKFLTQLKTIVITLSKGNEQGQEFLDELSQSLIHLKQLQIINIIASLSSLQQFPLALNQFLRNPNFCTVDLSFGERGGELSTNLSVQSTTHQLINLNLQSDIKQFNQMLRVMLSSLHNLHLEQDTSIQMSIQPATNFSFSDIGQVFRQIQTQKLSLIFTVEDISLELINEMISPSTRIKHLIQYKLNISFTQLVSIELFHHLATTFKYLEAQDIILQINDYNNQQQELQLYSLILNQLKDSKTINSLALQTTHPQGSKLKSIIKRLVKFTAKGFF